MKHTPLTPAQKAHRNHIFNECALALEQQNAEREAARKASKAIAAAVEREMVHEA